MVDTLWQDIRYAARSLRRTPGFTVAGVLTLALGIGANTAIFSVVNGVLLKPLAYPAPEELVAVWHTAPGLNITTDFPVAPSLYLTYREHNRVFQDIGLWQSSTATVTGVGDPEQVETLPVTEGTLSLLGVSPMSGRRFTAQDHAESSPDTVILSYDYWQRRFGGDASALGRVLTVNARPREVIGILPPSFRFLNQRPALLLPIRFASSQLILGLFNYQAVARLKPGVTISQANADVARMLPIWMRSFPPAPGFSPKLLEDARIAPTVRPFKQDAIGNLARVLWIVMATVGVVLLIACANVANLLLVRADGRRHELAVRLALGAQPLTIARELLSQSLILGLAGGAVGLGMAAVVLGLVKRTGPIALPRLDDISIDSTVLLFGLVMSMASGLLFGLVPVARFTTPQLSSALQGAGRTQTQSRERHRTQSTLAVVQVALALLLVSAGLLIRTFQNLRQVQPGFTQPEHVQTFRIVIPEAQLRDPEQVVRMQQAILDRIATIPGVTASSFGQSVPMDSRTDHDPIVVEGRADTDRQMANIRTYNFVAPGFFRAVGARLIAGRDFTWTDVYERRPVAVVSENLARELWGDPATGIGRRVRENLKGSWREVIGVVGDVHDEGIDRQAPTMVYWPTVMNEFLGQGVMVKRSIGFVIRSDRAGTESFTEELQNAVWGANKELRLADMQTLDAMYRRSMSRTSFALVMLAIAAAMALVLGLVGVYAVIASSVSRRTQEIGIRLALGGRRAQVMAHLLRHSLVLTATGIVIGAAGAVALTRFLEGILFGVSPLDPFTFLVVSLMLMIVALLAAHIPVHRATRLDPMAALRTE